MGQIYLYISVSDCSNPAIQSLHILATEGNENCESQVNEIISDTTRTCIISVVYLVQDSVTNHAKSLNADVTNFQENWCILN
jgi:hypothetical protein